MGRSPRSERVEALADAIPKGIRILVRRELNAVEEVVAPDEELMQMAAGVYEGKNGLVIATDRRVVFFEKGLTRSRIEDFLYGRISSVQSEKKMATGRLKIHASGNNAEIESIYPREAAVAIADLIRERIGDHPAPAAPAASAAPTDPAERMAKLAAMRDQGLVSDEEYEAKRAEILAEL